MSRPAGHARLCGFVAWHVAWFVDGFGEGPTFAHVRGVPGTHDAARGGGRSGATRACVGFVGTHYISHCGTELPFRTLASGYNLEYIIVFGVWVVCNELFAHLCGVIISAQTLVQFGKKYLQC